MTYIPLIEDIKSKLGLINAIKEVCEKKIYLEVQINYNILIGRVRSLYFIVG